jgi:hypothetical protein
VGLESLIGDSDGELTYKLAVRSAAICANDSVGSPLDPSRIFAAVKRLYAHRSAIIHGDTRRAAKTAVVEFPGGTTESADLAVFLLREVVLRFLHHQEWTDVSQIDEMILSRVAGSQ